MNVSTTYDRFMQDELIIFYNEEGSWKCNIQVKVVLSLDRVNYKVYTRNFLFSMECDI